MTPDRRIVIVEDEEIILADLEHTLREQGYSVVATASSGVEAVRATSAARPDLVLMDLRLQGSMSGLEAARRIQETAGIPVLFVTAHGSAMQRDLDGLPGRHRSIAKPFSPYELRASIEEILRK